MHVVHLVPTLSTSGGGITEAALGLAHALDRLPDLRVTVVPLRDASDTGRWAPLETRAFSRGALHSLAPDVVHLHGLWTRLSLGSRAFAPRTVVSPHGMLDPWALAQSKWKKRAALALVEKANLRHAGAIHVLSQAEAAAAAPFGTCSMIPNGVDTPGQSSTAHGAKHLVFLGRIHPKKGIAELLSAWRQSRVAKDQWTLTIAGWDDGGHRAELETNLPDGVTFSGPKFGEDKDALLRSASAFVLTSHSEGLPVGVLEAWSYGLPVLMTPACNLPEGFTEDAAFRCEPTPESIAAALKTLAATPPQALAATGANGRRLVGARFTWPAVARAFSTLYHKLPLPR